MTCEVGTMGVLCVRVRGLSGGRIERRQGRGRPGGVQTTGVRRDRIGGTSPSFLFLTPSVEGVVRRDPRPTVKDFGHPFPFLSPKPATPPLDEYPGRFYND